MSYIQNNLLAEESIIYQTKHHWIIFTTPVIFTIVAAILLLRHDLLVLIGYIMLLIALFQWLSTSVTYITSEFGVTNKRVIMKFGFIQRKSWETLLQKVASIQVDQSIIGRILNYGTIIIQSTGGAQDRFTAIDDPILFRRKVQEQIERPH